MRTVMKIKNPDVTVFSEFLPSMLCQALIIHAKEHVRRSLTIDPVSGTDVLNAARTSSGMFFRRGENLAISAIEEQISRITGIPVEHGEGLQVLRYEVGQQYHPHFDQFDTDRGNMTHILSRGGQRVATFLMYLNTPEEGGETLFPNAGISVSAVEGNALLFKYPTPFDKPLSLHSGSPVVKGEKWVATKWFREGVFT